MGADPPARHDLTLLKDAARSYVRCSPLSRCKKNAACSYMQKKRCCSYIAKRRRLQRVLKTITRLHIVKNQNHMQLDKINMFSEG